MTTTKSDYSGALADHFGRLEAEERERLFEATSCYWNSVASAADGEGQPRPSSVEFLAWSADQDQAEQLVEGPDATPHEATTEG